MKLFVLILVSLLVLAGIVIVTPIVGAIFLVWELDQ
jgi:hypothetical protein